jgi:ABC-type multidrug transport system ATPase subunit
VKNYEDHSEGPMEIRVQELQKDYDQNTGCSMKAPFCAVEGLSFGLSKGDCFALLGVNGAGKSTTFKTLVSLEKPTSGVITVQGMDITKKFQKVRKLIGYCPQYNPIFETLTVE